MSTSSREVRLRPEYAEVYRGIPPASLGRGASRSERWTRSTLSFEAPRTSPGVKVARPSAAVLAVMWLGVSFGAMDWLGTLLILTTIVLLAKKQTADTQSEKVT